MGTRADARKRKEEAELRARVSTQADEIVAYLIEKWHQQELARIDEGLAELSSALENAVGIDVEASARDWRGTLINVGDTIVFPYAWGGMPLSMCEGEIVEIEDDLLRVDLHYDTGSYVRKNDWAKPKCNVVTKVEPRVHAPF